MEPYNYETANEILKNRDSKKLKHETWLERISENEIAVVYHATSVVQYFKDGSVKLNNGGWATPTTKRRINLYQQCGKVFQEKFEWFFVFNRDFKNPIPFENGMVVSS